MTLSVEVCNFISWKWFFIFGWTMTQIALLIGDPEHIKGWRRQSLQYFLKTAVESSFSAAEALEGLRAWERDAPLDEIVAVLVQDKVPVSYVGLEEGDPDTQETEQEARRILDHVPEDRRGLELIRHLRHYFQGRAQGGQPVAFYLLTDKPVVLAPTDNALVAGTLTPHQDTVNYDLVEPHAA